MNITIKKIILILLIPFFKIINLFNFSRTKEQAVVVFYIGKLGDIVCASTIFPNIKNKDKNKKLIFIGRVPFIDILNNNLYLDEAIGFKNDKESMSLKWVWQTCKKLSKYKINLYYNLISNFSGGILGIYLVAAKRLTITSRQDNKSTAIINIFYKKYQFNYDKKIKLFYLDVLKDNGYKIINKKNQLFFNNLSDEIIDDLKKINSKNEITLGIVVGSGKDFKFWPKEHWVDLCDKLCQQKKATIIFFGGPGDEPDIKYVTDKIINKHYLVVNKPISHLPYYLKKCDIFVSVDTGLLYIADALNIPVVNIMGTCNEITQSPENIYRLISNSKYCDKFMYAPAEPVYHLRANEIKKCYSSITPDKVIRAINDLL